MEKLQYPIGKWEVPVEITEIQMRRWIRDIEGLPSALDEVLKDIRPDQWDLRYREGSWNVLQLVHHLADSHINAYERTKKAASGPTPIVVPYDENKWATMPDVCMETIGDSRALLKALHARWVLFLNGLTFSELMEKGYYHHGLGRIVHLAEAIGLYSWHSRHHLMHIKIALEGR